MSFTFQHMLRPSWAARRRIRAIYEATFAAEFRHGFRYLMRGVHTGARLLYVGCDTAARNRIVSIAILMRIPDTKAVYGEYFATDPSLQNQGIGRDIFNFLIGHLASELGMEALVFDAEMPKTDAPDDIDRRRLRYHERLGAQHIPQMAHYWVPNAQRQVPMYLMWVPLGDRTTPPDPPEIAAWVRSIFVTNGYDPALAERLIAEMNAAE